MLRIVPLLCFAFGVALTCFSVALVGIERDERGDLARQRVALTVDERAARLANYLGRVEVIIGATASSGSAGRLIAGRPVAADDADSLDSLLHLHGVLSGATGEVSLLRADGTRLVETNEGRLVAEPSALPVRGARPGFGTRLTRTRPYRSAATGRWVVGYLTPVGEGHLLVELAVRSLAWNLAESDTRDDLRVVDRATGAVVVVANRPQPDTGPLGDPGDRRWQGQRRNRATGGVVRSGRSVTATRALPHLGQANDWVVVATDPEATPRWAASVTRGAVGVGSAGLLLLLIAIVGLRRHRHDLEAQARTDSLTGLGNRRRLEEDLGLAARTATPELPIGVLILDLDGFKDYNDGFGHLAGDALLARLGAALHSAFPGRAYRLGGDEFCVVVDGDEVETAIDAGRAALTERGDGFAITATAGAARIPAEARTRSAALRLADHRMYALKAGGRSSAGGQVTGALLQIVTERHAALGEHGGAVADLAEEVGRRMELGDEELLHIRRAARLHDVGKLAIPDAILNKTGPLNAEEWEFMRQHSEIGERILASAPSMWPAARIVRSCHEAWDGGGYPDGLAGEQIPLAARIIAACDALDAMCSDRPYRAARSLPAALAELRRCAGKQFDSDVVEVVASVACEQFAALVA